MRKRPLLFALSVLCAALFAMPAAASAGEWDLDGAAGLGFAIKKVTNPVLTVTNGDTVNCTGLGGNGLYATDTTGQVTMVFTGCTESTFGTACTSPGEAAGTIAIANKEFHNVIIGNFADNNTPIGILITIGKESEAKCSFGLINIKLTGNVIGEVETPGCGVVTKNLKINFVSSSHGTQKYQQVTTTGTKYDLLIDIGSEEKTGSLDATYETVFVKDVKPTCQ
jgi:hypothetical protein